jgi:hypothetical protein
MLRLLAALQPRVRSALRPRRDPRAGSKSPNTGCLALPSSQGAPAITRICLTDRRRPFRQPRSTTDEGCRAHRLSTTAITWIGDKIRQLIRLKCTETLCVADEPRCISRVELDGSRMRLLRVANRALLIKGKSTMWVVKGVGLVKSQSATEDAISRQRWSLSASASRRTGGAPCERRAMPPVRTRRKPIGRNL